MPRNPPPRPVLFLEGCQDGGVSIVSEEVDAEKNEEEKSIQEKTDATMMNLFFL